MASPSTLKELQAYMKTLAQKREWDGLSHSEKFLLFTEEVGELAKAIRHHLSLCQENPTPNPSSKASSIPSMEEEFADVFNYLLDLANGLNIDLEEAFWKKDATNQKRTWQK